MGEVAARTVCHAVSSYWEENPDIDDSEYKIITACNEASEALDKRADELNHVGMGTTLVMACIEGNKVTIAHCGDSRCYLLRDGNLLHQTKDHINPDSGWEVVSKCFFSYRRDAAQAETIQFDLKKGDRIFLCTDGVYKAAAPEILVARLMDDKPLEDVVDVVKFLCEKYSDDNYTGILLQIA